MHICMSACFKVLKPCVVCRIHGKRRVQASPCVTATQQRTAHHDEHFLCAAAYSIEYYY